MSIPPALPYRFCLFVADEALNSVQAVANLTAICQEYLPNGYEIEVVDVFEHPARALAEKVFMTPTLIRLEPTPVRRIVGNLSQTDTVLQVLGLAVMAP